jgi:hypothetical protein
MDVHRRVLARLIRARDCIVAEEKMSGGDDV